MPGVKKAAKKDKAVNLGVQEPSDVSDNETEDVSSLPTPGEEFLKGGLVFGKSVKMVSSALL